MESKEQIESITEDSVMFILESVSTLFVDGTKDISGKDELFTQFQKAMSDFIHDGHKDHYGEKAEDRATDIAEYRSEIEEIELAEDVFPEFQELAREQGLKYSVSGINSTTGKSGIMIIKFSKSEIDGMTKVCMDIARKSMERSKIPLDKTLHEQKQNVQHREAQREKAKGKAKGQEPSQ